MSKECCTPDLPSTELALLVNTYDIDVAGHVNNIVFIRWLEDMRNKLFSQIYSLQALLESHFYLVVVECEMKYKKQIKLFDKPVGKMTMQSYSHGVIILKAEIITDNCTAFTAMQKCVMLNLNDNKMLKKNIWDMLK